MTTKHVRKIIIFLFIISPCENFKSEKLIASVSAAIAKRYNTQCASILHPSKLPGTEYQQLFSLAKKLVTDPHFQQPASTITFRDYLTVRRISAKTTRCPTVMFIILGWLTNCTEEFSEFTHKMSPTGIVWLVFLENDTSQNFLKEADTPFFMNLIMVSIGDDNKNAKLEEAYRVDRNYPLRVKKFGDWTNGTFSSPPELSIYSRRYDLEGVPLRATTKDDYPLCFLEKVKNEYKIGGYFGMLFYELAQNLNFTPVYVPATKNVTGAPNINGTWDGILGMLQRNEIDLSVGPHALDHHVMDIGSFVRPLFKTRYTIFFKEGETKLEWGAIWKPFGSSIWILICTWIFLSSVVINKLYSFECQFGNENHIYKKEFFWANLFFFSLKALCQQGHERVPKSYTCRIIFLSSYVLSTVLVTAYSASLISHITTREPTRPFDSLESFRDHGSYKLVAIGSSTDYVYFSEASDNLRKEIYERFMKFVPDSEFIFKKEDGLDIICSKGKFALFITFDIPDIAADKYSEDPSRDCVILHLKSHLDSTFLSIVRRKDLPYGDLIDTEIIRYFDLGIAHRLHKNSWPLKKKPSDSDKIFYQVTLEQILQVHLILWFGMGLSIVIAIFEILIHHRERIILRLMDAVSKVSSRARDKYFLNISK